MSRAGRYRNRIDIQTATETQGTSGAVTQSWVSAGTKWASIWPMKSGEQVVAQRTEGTVTHQIRWRFDAALSITTKAQIVHEGRTFRVLGFMDDKEARRETIAECQEITG